MLGATNNTRILSNSLKNGIPVARTKATIAIRVTEPLSTSAGARKSNIKDIRPNSQPRKIVLPCTFLQVPSAAKKLDHDKLARGVKDWALEDTHPGGTTYIGCKSRQDLGVQYHRRPS